MNREQFDHIAERSAERFRSRHPRLNKPFVQGAYDLTSYSSKQFGHNEYHDVRFTRIAHPHDLIDDDGNVNADRLTRCCLDPLIETVAWCIANRLKDDRKSKKVKINPDQVFSRMDSFDNPDYHKVKNRKIFECSTYPTPGTFPIRFDFEYREVTGRMMLVVEARACGVLK